MLRKMRISVKDWHNFKLRKYLDQSRTFLKNLKKQKKKPSSTKTKMKNSKPNSFTFHKVAKPKNPTWPFSLRINQSNKSILNSFEMGVKAKTVTSKSLKTTSTTFLQKSNNKSKKRKNLNLRTLISSKCSTAKTISTKS